MKGAWKRPTEEQVVAASTDQWGGIMEVAQRLGTKHYATVTRTLHRLHEQGRADDRWVPGARPDLPRRQYLMRGV